MKRAETVLIGLVLIGGLSLALIFGVFLEDGDEGGSLPEMGVDRTKETPALSDQADRDRIEDPAVFEPEKVPVHPDTTGPDGSSTSDSALRQDREGAILGRIINEYGEPLAGATVRFDLDPMGMIIETMNRKKFESITLDEKVCTSGDDGRFRLEGVGIRDSSRLLVSHPEYVPGELKLGLIESFPLDVGDISVDLGGSISGRVSNTKGAALASAEVVARPVEIGKDRAPARLLMRSDGDSPWNTVTRPDGYYRITGLPPGKVQVMALHPDYLGETVAAGSVTKGRDKPGVDIVLTEGEIISGQVLDASDKPVQGAEVRIDQVLHLDLGEAGSLLPEMMRAPMARTGGDGTFMLKGLREGTHTVRVHAQGFLSFKDDHVPAGTRDFLAILKKGGWLAGRVADARTDKALREFDIEVEKDRFMGTAYKVYKGAEAAARMPGDEDPEGAFYVEGLEEGTYSLCFSAAGYGDEEIRNITTMPGEGQSIEVKLWEEAVVSGRLVSRSGDPVAGGTVSLEKAPQGPAQTGGARTRAIRIERSGDEIMFGGEEPIKSVESGKDGTFALRGIPEGDFQLTGMHPDHTDAVPLPVAVERGERIEGMVVRLGASGAIQGTVYGVDGAPKQGARVMAGLSGASGMSEKTAVSGSDGTYRLNGLIPGEYLVHLADTEQGIMFGGAMSLRMLGGEGDPAGSERVVVEEGNVFELDIYEPMKGILAGRVTEAGRAVQGIDVKVFEGDRFQLFPKATGSTDEDGGFRFEGLSEGTYTVQLTLAGLPEPPKERITIKGGEEVRQDFSLPSGRITGRITDSDTGGPVPGAKVTLEAFKKEDEQPQETRQVRMEFRVARVESSSSGGGISSVSITGGGPQEVTTDEDGRYEIRFIKDGEYKVVASGGGYAKDELAPVAVTEGRETSNKNLKLKRGYVVTGVLLESATGYKLAHTPISYGEMKDGKPGDSWSTFVTQEDGRFTIPDLRPGTYRLQTVQQDHTGTMDFTVDKEDLKDLEFRVQKK